ncbi:hypothetical protein QUA00_34700, partial [Microcoleus sp. T2B6]|uniref:hypothetical protein n=1 Tax=Microcoleus sp. T2B6 TaxID=3055424 RepID=UPI002FD0BD6E
LVYNSKCLLFFEFSFILSILSFRGLPPVPQQKNIFVEQASCLLELCFQNRQDACSTTEKYFCGADRLPAIVMSSGQARCLFHNKQKNIFVELAGCLL